MECDAVEPVGDVLGIRLYSGEGGAGEPFDHVTELVNHKVGVWLGLGGSGVVGPEEGAHGLGDWEGGDDHEELPVAVSIHRLALDSAYLVIFADT